MRLSADFDRIVKIAPLLVGDASRKVVDQLPQGIQGIFLPAFLVKFISLIIFFPSELSMSANLESMTPEQLRKLVLNMQRQLEKRDRQAAKQEKRAKKQEQRIAALEERVEFQEKKEQLLTGVLEIAARHQACESVLSQMRELLDDFAGPRIDDEVSADLYEKLSREMQAYVTAVLTSENTKAMLRKVLFGSGTEKLGHTVLEKTGTTESTNVADSSAYASESVEDADLMDSIPVPQNDLTLMLKFLPEVCEGMDKPTKAAGSITRIRSAYVPKRKFREKGKSLGRQKTDPDIDRETMPCPSRTFMVRGKTYEKKEDGVYTQDGVKCTLLRTVLQSVTDLQCRAGDLVKKYEACGEVYLDPQNEQVFVVRHEEAPIPVTPGSTMSVNMAVAAALAEFQGIPLERFKQNVKEARFGHSTINGALMRFADVWLRPVYDAIVQLCREAPVLLCDETSFNCLEQQGRGVNGKKTSEDKKRRTNYLLCLSNPVDSAVPFTVYHSLAGRSAESIGSVIGGDRLSYTTLITDGYSAYKTILNDLVDIRTVAHQVCLIHFRRAVLKCLASLESSKNFCDMSEEELLAKMEEFVLRADAYASLAGVVLAIGKIYAILKARYGSEDYEELDETKAQEAIRALMDEIDELMTDLGKSEGTKRIAEKACSYYEQNREALRLFIDRADMPPDTNLVERAIRPITILRKNSYFSQTVKGKETLCMIFTVLRTAELCGIKNLGRWLRRMTEAAHAFAENEALTTNWAKDSDPATVRVLTEDYRAALNRFDWTPWFPWNYGEAEG